MAKVTFISNYINHHQTPFCRAMAGQPDVDFAFVETEPMEEERRAMGWGAERADAPGFALYRIYEDEAGTLERIRESDVILMGWTTNEQCHALLRHHLDEGGLAFYVSERIYREGRYKAVSPRGLIDKYRRFIRYRGKDFYLLCAGAYVAGDFALIGAFHGKRYTWGYFPEGDADENTPQAADKDASGAAMSLGMSRTIFPEGKPMKILWAGRFLHLKHPEVALRAARDLMLSGKTFEMTMIGDGPIHAEMVALAEQLGLADKVSFPGFKTAREVRAAMAEADVFLFTSDHLEGWGAVVSEAMEKGCLVAGSKQAGAVPSLIEDGVNGLVYDLRSPDELGADLIWAAEHPERCREMGKKAAASMRDVWNADTAAARLCAFIETRLDGGAWTAPQTGPMSPADRRWHQKFGG